MARRNFGRPKAQLILSEAQRAVLERYRDGETPRALALRARIVLLCAEGRTNEAVASIVGVLGVTVGKWRSRFIEHGVDGLRDAPRPNTHRRLSEDKVATVVRLALESAPTGRSRWSTRAMAAQAGISQSSVSRLWARLPPEARQNLKMRTRSDDANSAPNVG
jgi:transposase